DPTACPVRYRLNGCSQVGHRFDADPQDVAAGRCPSHPREVRLDPFGVRLPGQSLRIRCSTDPHSRPELVVTNQTLPCAAQGRDVTGGHQKTILSVAYEP